MTTTDTPRTDAFCEELPDTDFNHANWQQVVKIADFARELERELKRANDEIEFYEKIGQKKVDELRASKAEVERLRKTNATLENSLRRIIDAPVIDPSKLIDFSMKLLWDSIAEAKSTINPDKK